VILVDTSVLIDAFTGPRDLLAALTATVRLGERLGFPALVLYEYLRGPRTQDEIAQQEWVFPAHSALPFGPAEAAIAARLYRTLARPRQRETDIAIAATALTHEAALWTVNTPDFRDIPGLRLYEAPS
jgi:predicted nucleic acid-binding protein